MLDRRDVHIERVGPGLEGDGDVFRTNRRGVKTADGISRRAVAAARSAFGGPVVVVTARTSMPARSIASPIS